MQKLANNQILSICELGNHPLVDFADLSFHNSGNVHICLVSRADADMSEILEVLNDVFPVMTVQAKPFCVSRDDGTISNVYDVLTNGETVLSLHMIYTQKEKPSAPTESTEELTQPEYTTTWTPEEILRQEASHV